jgi:4'-phosphopantetheinyl transferase
MLRATILVMNSKLKPDEFDRLISLVSPERRKRISRFLRDEDAHRALLGEVLARAEISSITGLRNSQLNFGVGEYGKPYLTNNPHLKHNISHSGKYIVCAVSSNSVGIDVEMMSGVNRGIAERFFAPDEAEYVDLRSEEERRERFYQIWTMKESHVKWEGLGLSKPLASFSVLSPELINRPYYSLVFKNDEAICHLCTSLQKEVTVKTIAVSDLLNSL